MSQPQSNSEKISDFNLFRLISRRGALKLTVGQKIGFGYSLAVGVALLGTMVGMGVGDYYQKRAWTQRIHTQGKLNLLHRLETGIVQVQTHEHQLIVLIEDPSLFQEEYTHLLQNIREVEKVLDELEQAAALPTGIEEGGYTKVKEFLETHKNFLLVYFDLLSQRIRESNPSHIQSVTQMGLRQKHLLEFTNSAIALRMGEIFHGLVKLIQASDQELEVTVQADIASNKLRSQIIVWSLIGSIAMASFLAFWTSRAITRPLRKVTQGAQAITAESNFSLRVPVITEDEVGTLAQSLNDLVQRVQDLLQEQKLAAEQQLIQNEKMASLGQMVSGIAHEINNPVSCISGNLTYITQYVDDLLDLVQTYEKVCPRMAELEQKEETIEWEFLKQDLPELVRSMKMGAEQTREIVGSLSNFSRLDGSVIHAVDLHECLDNTLLILNNRIKKGIKIERHYGDLPTIDGYRGPLHQVFMNLLSNAIDALEQGGVKQASAVKALGDLSETVSRTGAEGGENKAEGTRQKVEAGSKVIWIDTKVMAGRRVLVEISDNGPGIAPEHVQKIFEMFFTTKPVGVGTGLGLAISHQIVAEKHGGQLSCRSQLGVGSTFSVILPMKQPCASSS